MRYSPFQWFVTLLGIALVASGCEQPDAAPVTTDMHEDFIHDHEHVHGQGHDHEHEHADGHEGRHSHPHEHSHRHGEPLHGGRIVSIGHTHHRDGETHYHAEVMPLTGGVISFYILTESAEGETQEFPIDAQEITAYIAEQAGDSNQAAHGQEVKFTVDAAIDSAEFRAAVPEVLAQSERLSIVVPKVVLGGERFNFSFRASRAASTDDSTDADEDSQ